MTCFLLNSWWQVHVGLLIFSTLTLIFCSYYSVPKKKKCTLYSKLKALFSAEALVFVVANEGSTFIHWWYYSVLFTFLLLSYCVVNFLFSISFHNFRFQYLFYSIFPLKIIINLAVFWSIQIFKNFIGIFLSTSEVFFIQPRCPLHSVLSFILTWDFLTYLTRMN